MRTLPASRAVCLASLLGAIVPPAALAQRTELPPINPAPVARTAASLAATPAVTTTPKAALVQVIDDDAHGAYKEGVFTSCSVAGVCTVTFSAVPAGHRRIVEHLSCSVYAATPGALRYVAFLANSFTAPRDWLPYTRSAADAGQYFINSPALFPFEAGESPLIYAYADAAAIQDLTCTATGRDVVLP